MLKEYTIGTDVEFFLRSKLTGEIINAEGIIQGSKHRPYKFTENPYYATSLDNVLAEGNIPPARSADEFVGYLRFLRDYIESTLPEDLETVAMAAARLREEQLLSPNARRLGCDESYCCWTGEIIKPKVKKGENENLRAAGFHIHVGYPEPTQEQNISLAKIMDLYLGVPSILIEPENERRKSGYGAAGNFRHQPHGVEYRTLSSYFASSEELIRWAYSNTEESIKQLDNIKEIDKMGETIQIAINRSDIQMAKDLVSRFGIKCPM